MADAIRTAIVGAGITVAVVVVYCVVLLVMFGW